MPRAGTTRTFTISFPPELAEQVEHMAKKESRTTSELFREAFRAYRAERIRTSLDRLNELASQSGHNGNGPAGVEQLVDEVRAEMWAEKHR